MTYFFGKLCAKHPELKGKRYTKEKKCISCVSLRGKKLYAANPEKYKTKSRIAYEANPRKALVQNKLWQLRNPEKVAKAKKQWKLRNIEQTREANRKYALLWIKNNYERKLAANAKRRAIRKGMIVSLTAEEQNQIKNLYVLAKQQTISTGIPHQVDHDKPLSQGGKHHPGNMHVIPAAMNLSKGARYPSTLDFLLS